MNPGGLLCAGRKERTMSNRRRRRTREETVAPNNEVKALAEAGLKQVEIAEKLGIQGQRVSEIVRGLHDHASTNVRKRRLTKEEREVRNAAMVEAYKAGATVADLARDFSMSGTNAALIIRDWQTGGEARRIENEAQRKRQKRYVAAADPISRADTLFSRGFLRTDIHETDEDNLRAMQKMFRIAKWANHFSGADRFDADFIEVDHIVPISAGGGHTLENIQLIRRGDHLAKTKEQYLCQKDDCMNLTPGEDYMHCRPCSWNDHVLQREFDFDGDGNPIIGDAA